MHNNLVIPTTKWTLVWATNQFTRSGTTPCLPSFELQRNALGTRLPCSISSWVRSLVRSVIHLRIPFPEYYKPCPCRFSRKSPSGCIHGHGGTVPSWATELRKRAEHHEWGPTSELSAYMTMDKATFHMGISRTKGQKSNKFYHHLVKYNMELLFTARSPVINHKKIYSPTIVD